MDTDAALDPTSTTDAGIPAGRQLLAFANAVEGQSNDIETARSELLAEVGTDGVLEAAGTIAIFNGLIRVADGTGIRLDDGLNGASSDERDRLGINDYAGAASTLDTDRASPDPLSSPTVKELFS